MKLVAAALLLGACASAEAATGRVCGTVSVLERPLPSGFINLISREDASRGRALARLRDGKFCLEGLEPGAYALSVSPPNHAEPMAAGFRGFPGTTEDYTLVVDRRGALTLRGRDEKIGRPADALNLEYLPAPASSAAPRLRGTLTFSGAPAPQGPALILARAAGSPASSDGRGRYALAWTSDAPDGKSKTFDVQLSSGFVACVEARLPGWGVAAMKPGLWDPEGRSITLEASRAARVELALRPAGAVRGTVRLPGGEPLRPALGPDAARRLYRLRVEGLMGDYVVDAYADQDGAYEVDGVSAGVHTLTFLAEGAGFAWAPPRARLAWVDPGGVVAADSRLAAASELLLADEQPAFAALDAAAARGEQLWIIGLEPSSAPVNARRFLLHDEAPVAIYRGSAGDWQAWDLARTATPQGASFKTAAGVFDFYLLALAPLGRSVRILARAPAVALAPGAQTSLRFPAPVPRPGRGALRLSLEGWRPPDLKAMRASKTLFELLSWIVPEAALYDQTGRHAASAFSTIGSWDRLPLFQDALDFADAAALAAAAGRPRELEVAGLAPGRYELRVNARGARDVRMDVVVEDERPTTLKLDLSPEAPAKAAVLRGSVGYDGCPVPHVLVSVKPDPRPWPGEDALGGGRPHPGASRRELFSLDGAFEAADLAPGNYLLEARMTFGLNASLPAAAPRERLSVTPEGVRRYDAAGVRLPDGDARLEVKPSPLPARPGLFRGTVRFLSGPAPDFCARPVFLAAKAMNGAAPAFLTRVKPAPGGDGGIFELPVERGRAYVLQLQSTHWGPARSAPQTDEITVSSVPVDMELDVVPAGAARVQVFGLDGKPYAPDFTRDYLDARMSPDAMCFDRQVKPDGTLDFFGVPPGKYIAEVFGRGPRATWAAPALQVDVEAGRTALLELRLSSATPVRLAARPLPAGVPEKALPAPQNFDGRERWVRPLIAGTRLDVAAASQLMMRELHGPFQFRNERPGVWRSPQAAEQNVARAPAGRYDVYLLETSIGWGDTAYLRVVARRPDWKVPAPATDELTFAGSPAVWGEFALSGELRGVATPSPDTLSALKGDFLRFMARHAWLVLRDANGAPAAFAWPRPDAVEPANALVTLTRALATGSFEDLRARLAKSRYVFEIPHLPAGRYEAQAGSWDCPSVKKNVTLGPGSGPLLLDLACPK